jgi:hypothetical protein
MVKPTTFIIYRQGEIYDYIVGPTNENVLIKYLHKLSNQVLTVLRYEVAFIKM